VVNAVHLMDYVTGCVKVYNYMCAVPLLIHTMSRDADKHIRVTEETWLELNRQKRPGDSFDDVLQRLLAEEQDQAAKSEQ